MKITASRLSEGNKVFPAEIHIESTGLTVKIPGLFSGKTEYFDFKSISNVSVNTPMIGFATITFRAAGARVSAHGFSGNEVNEIKKAIEEGKIEAKIKPILKDHSKESIQLEERVKPATNSIETKRLEGQIETEKLKQDLRVVKNESRRSQIADLNESYKGGSKNFGYYIQLGWIFLDTPLKKGIAIVTILSLMGEIYKRVLSIISK